MYLHITNCDSTHLQLSGGFLHDVLHAVAHLTEHREALLDGVAAVLFVLDRLLQFHHLILLSLAGSGCSDRVRLLSEIKVEEGQFKLSSRIL